MKKELPYKGEYEYLQFTSNVFESRDNKKKKKKPNTRRSPLM